MKNLKNLISLYKSIIGWKILIALSLLMLFPPILEGLSATLILPLLQGVDADNPINNTFRAVFEFLNINYTFLNILISYPHFS